jgi:hypothetical protein
MVTAPERAFDVVFGATTIVTDPAPSPFDGDSLTHDRVSVTDHGQPPAHETLTEVEVPAWPTLDDVLPRANVQLAALSVTVNVWLATLSAALRDTAVPLAAAVNLTVPGPLPPVGVTVSHPASLVADHAQPVTLVTFTVPLPPSAGTACPLLPRL